MNANINVALLLFDFIYQTTIFLSTSDNCKVHLKYFNILSADFLFEQVDDIVKDKPQKALVEQYELLCTSVGSDFFSLLQHSDVCDLRVKN